MPTMVIGSVERFWADATVRVSKPRRSSCSQASVRLTRAKSANTATARIATVRAGKSVVRSSIGLRLEAIAQDHPITLDGLVLEQVEHLELERPALVRGLDEGARIAIPSRGERVLVPLIREAARPD